MVFETVFGEVVFDAVVFDEAVFRRVVLRWVVLLRERLLVVFRVPVLDVLTFDVLDFEVFAFNGVEPAVIDVDDSESFGVAPLEFTSFKGPESAEILWEEAVIAGSG